MQAKSRLLLLPIAFARNGSHGIRCHYLLYPLRDHSKQTRSLMDGALRVATIWKSGLWVVGRFYRNLWNSAFKPNSYCQKEYYTVGKNHEISNNETMRHRVFDWSDRTVWAWSPSAEEVFLKQFPTDVELYRGREKYSIPVKQIEVLVPRQCMNVSLESPFHFPSALHREKSLNPKNSLDKLSIFIKDQLKHLADFGSVNCSILHQRSKITLAITIPFVFVWKYSLESFDKLLQIAVNSAESLRFFQGLENLISLPLAYNIIKLLSYRRAFSSGKLIENILNSDDKNDVMFNLIDDMGHVLSAAIERANNCENYEFLSNKELFQISKVYGIAFPEFHKDMLRARERLMMWKRLCDRIKPKQDLDFRAPVSDDLSLLNLENISKKRRGFSTIGSKDKKPVKRQKTSFVFHPLTLKCIKSGMTMLGCIREVRDLELVVSLPYNLVGIVPATKICNQLSRVLEEAAESEDIDIPNLFELFEVNQFVEVVVVDVEDKRIRLSMHPDDLQGNWKQDMLMCGMLVQCSVRSVEDYGYIVDSGIENCEAFLSKKNYVGTADLKPMQTVLAVIDQINGRSLILTTKSLDKPVTIQQNTELLIDAKQINAGLKVCCEVTKASRDGLNVKFLDCFKGEICFANLCCNENYKDLMKVGSRFNARIIYALPSTESDFKFSLSLNPNILDLKQPALEILPSIGSYVSDLRVVHSDSNFGLFMTGSDNNDKISYFCHVTQVNPVNNKKVIPNARVISFDRIQNFVNVSCLEEVLNAQYISASQVKIGDVVDNVKFLAFDPNGAAILQLSECIKAVCPATHLADMPTLAYPERRFNAKNNIKCRILNVLDSIGGKRKVIVTCKKTLLDPSLLVLRDLQEAKMAIQKHSGDCFTFAVVNNCQPFGYFLSLFGDLTGFMPQKFAQDQEFVKGQLVKCRLVSIERDRLLLSTLSRNRGAAGVIGNIYFNASIGSDDQILVDGLTGTLTPDSNKDDLNKVVLIKPNLFSNNPVIIWAAENKSFPSAWDQLTVGHLVVGTVAQILPNQVGVRLSLGPKLNALIPMRHLSDEYLEDFSSFPIGLAVLAVVLEIDQTAQRIVCSSKDSLLPTPQDLLISMSPTNTMIRSEWKVCKELPKIGFMCQRDKEEGILLHEMSTGDVKCGQTMDALCLDRDTRTGISDLTNLKRFAATPIDVSRKAVKATVLLSKSDYLIVAVKQSKSLKYVGKVVSRILNKRLTAGDLKQGDEIVVDIIDGKFLFNNNVDSIKSSAKALSLEEYKVGDTVKAVVKSLRPMHANILISKEPKLIEGRLHKAEIPRHLHTFEAAGVKVGAHIEAKVCGFVSTRTHKWLPITHRQSVKDVIDLTMTSDDLNLKVGAVTGGFVEELISGSKKYALKIALSSRLSGRVPLIEMADGNFVVGQWIKCAVLSLGDSPELTLRFFGDDRIFLDYKDLRVGDGIKGKIVSTNGSHFKVLLNSRGLFGQLSVCELSNDYGQVDFSKFDVGTLVDCSVLSIKDDIVQLTCRNINETDGRIKTIDDVTEGMLSKGIIRNINNGVFVAIGPSITARVKISELSDDYLKQWQNIYSLNQVVTCKILSINHETNQVEATLKLSAVDPEKYAQIQNDGRMTWKDLLVGQVLPAKVCRLFEKSAVLVELDNTRSMRREYLIRAKCNLEDGQSFAIGDHVKCRLVEIDLQSHKIIGSLSLAETEEAENEEVFEDIEVKESVEMFGKGRDLMEICEEDEINWGDETTLVADQEIVVEGKPEKQTILTEDEIRSKEARLAESEILPETANEFERLLLANPNSSYLWIQYMSFLVKSAEVQKAREAARKALQTIDYRETGEKLNVWIAYLNLENAYGSPETLAAVFEEAKQFNEPLKVYQAMSQILEKNNRLDEAREMHRKITGKFKSSVESWLAFIKFLYAVDKDLVEARSVCDKALQSLACTKREQVDFMVKIIQMEFQYGDVDRARTVYEGLLASYPRRTDLWSIVVDFEAKHGNLSACRRLLERAIHLKLTSKKMKFLFKKYLEFERKNGTEESVQQVIAKATEYVTQLCDKE